MLLNDQTRLSQGQVPGPRAAALSGLAHFLVLIMVLLFLYAPRAVVAPQKNAKAVQIISTSSHLAYSAMKANPVPPHMSRPVIHRSKRQMTKTEAKASEGSETGEVLREHAKKETAAMMTDMRFRTTYGFSATDYHLPVHTAGALPTISASDLPPRYEQYLIVEITIDIEGKVADARITSGQVAPKVQNILLAAIRRFQYVPAKHNGAPVPSQLDIVVHVPNDV